MGQPNARSGNHDFEVGYTQWPKTVRGTRRRVDGFTSPEHVFETPRPKSGVGDDNGCAGCPAHRVRGYRSHVIDDHKPEFQAAELDQAARWSEGPDGCVVQTALRLQ